jgi:ferritin-like metal-binding protein YciE
MAMGLLTRDIETMDDLFVHQSQDVCYAEKQLVKALPGMAEQEAGLAGARQGQPQGRELNYR